MKPLEGLAWINGTITPLQDARVSVMDRGFLFGDGVYEVVRVRAGIPFRLDDHLARLWQSMQGIRQVPDRSREVFREDIMAFLGQASAWTRREALLYLQVTRGVAPRHHAFPPVGTPLTWVMAVWPFEGPDARLYEEGVAVITVPEIRWGRVDLKTINLLPNVLAKEEAHRRGAFEALFITEDGEITEGSSTSFFLVVEGRVVVPPRDTRVLPGITRAVLEDILHREEIPCDVHPLHRDLLKRAQEAFLASTTLHVMPVVRVDEQKVGEGRPGPVTRKLSRAFLEVYHRETGG